MSENQRWRLVENGVLQSARQDLPQRIETSSGAFELKWERLSGGKQDGVDVLWIDTGTLKTAILPTRGMGIWKCWLGELEIGWQSPTTGPVHPSFVPVHDPNGIGWLEGFDEFVVRCGLQSNGAPEFDAHGHLKYPLHGRIANIPAHSVSVEVDPLAGTLDVHSVVDEARFLIYGLRLQTHLQFRVGQSTITMTDKVTNLFSRPTTMQLLYHINIGQPILEAGTQIVAACRQVAPRDAAAAANYQRWDICEAPSDGFAEQVYLTQPVADANGWTTALLHDHQAQNGVAVRFDTRSLPYMTIWKNTMAVEEGYVVGIEPATGFPNTRKFEELQGRLVALAGGQTKSYRVQIEPTDSAYRVRELIESIQLLKASEPTVLSAPDRNWSA
jgi:galactose mutarotase-like enzyme